MTYTLTPEQRAALATLTPEQRAALGYPDAEPEPQAEQLPTAAPDVGIVIDAVPRLMARRAQAETLAALTPEQRAALGLSKGIGR